MLDKIKEKLNQGWNWIKNWYSDTKKEIQEDGFKSYFKKRVKKVLIATGIVAGTALAAVIGLQPSQIPPLDFNGQITELLHTDNNDNENMPIYTDKELYRGAGEIEMYMGIKNKSGKNQANALHFFFSQDTRFIRELYRLEENATFQKDVPIYEDYSCDWFNGTTSQMVEETCQRVKGYESKEVTEDRWVEIALSDFNDSGYDALIKDLEVSPKDKKGYKAKKVAPIFLTDDEIIYLKAVIQFPILKLRKQEEFFIEIVGGDKGYGHLDPHITADLIDENYDYSNITDYSVQWSDGDTNGTSDVRAGQVGAENATNSYMHAGAGDAERGYEGEPDIPGQFTLELRTWLSGLWTNASNEVYQVGVSDGIYRLDIHFANDGLHIFNGSSYVEAGTDLVVEETWQLWRFLANSTTGDVDVYLDDTLAVADIDWTYGYVSDYLFHRTKGGSDTIAWVDFIYIGSGEQIPTAAGAAEIQTQVIKIRGR